ncbi:MAG: L,D-transpeptidase [Candidatus Portnoybacteria bacterium]|nr:L,D-transpeptidase [Candidatus Portnoybacteria bacterium]
MQKRIIFYLSFSAVFLAIFCFHVFYLLPQNMNPGSFLLSAINSACAPKSDKLIRINLYNKSLVMIEKGQLKKLDKIAAAGNPKYSPTPTGNFKVLTKSKRIISSLSGLVMPLSLRIKGPYFLHGIPTTKDGRIYSSEYSSGCIRLGPGLDQEIYDWADIGTRVEIYNSSLVKAPNKDAVYYLRPDGTKEPIASPEEFLSRGFKWKDVKAIHSAELDAFPLAESTAVEI